MTYMLDDRFDDQLKDSAREYNTPPVTPQEEMWAAIQARRAEAEKAEETEKTEGSGTPVIPLRPFRPLRLAGGIAALLALGIGIGRMSAPKPGPVAPVIATSMNPPRTGEAAYRITATEHLGQAEAFLTLFRVSVRRGGNEQLASATARQLLATNRLLLDSPAASDARTRLLLQDLELVLAEIAQLAPRPSSPDLDLITEGLERGGMMSRLRTAVPSGASPTQGAL
ncbi:MAG TPA: hypothetical protein VGP44_01855 [Gemmatimonadales bacterium]|nr:hypothetical protein [Gemmatimonadales bacterium]